MSTNIALLRTESQNAARQFKIWMPVLICVFIVSYFFIPRPMMSLDYNVVGAIALTCFAICIPGLVIVTGSLIAARLSLWKAYANHENPKVKALFESSQSDRNRALIYAFIVLALLGLCYLVCQIPTLGRAWKIGLAAMVTLGCGQALLKALTKSISYLNNWRQLPTE